MKLPGSFQFELRQGTTDVLIIEEVVRRRIYLKSFILPFIKPNGLVIDIGAHIGSFAIQACSLLHPKTVLAIEPSPTNFEYLLRNVVKSRLGRLIHPIEMALWNQPTEASLYCPTSNHGGHSLIPTWREWMIKTHLENSASQSNVYSVHTDTLDNVLTTLRLENQNINLIKIDVEGAEKQVLQGASNALRRCAAVVGELHEPILAENDLRKLMKKFVVAIGEPFSPLRLSTFWAVRREMMKSKVALREFERAAHVADMEDRIWKLEQELSIKDKQVQALVDSFSNQLKAVRNSVSWRITDPIRRLASVAFALRKLQPEDKSEDSRNHAHRREDTKSS